jgi:hypothetical protein
MKTKRSKTKNSTFLFSLDFLFVKLEAKGVVYLASCNDIAETDQSSKVVDVPSARISVCFSHLPSIPYLYFYWSGYFVNPPVSFTCTHIGACHLTSSQCTANTCCHADS